MKLLIGLGNPGKKYENTRHNTGHKVIDKIDDVSRIKYQVLCIKPQEGMNNSGKTVKKLVDQYKLDLDNLYVIFDDLDIPLGKYKIVKGSGPKDHRGLLSVYKELGTSEFWHVRVGIENRSLPKISGEIYTLQDFTDEEKPVINSVINEVVKCFKK